MILMLQIFDIFPNENVGYKHNELKSILLDDNRNT